jgi:hypothetical protein
MKHVEDVEVKFQRSYTSDLHGDELLVSLSDREGPTSGLDVKVKLSL